MQHRIASMDFLRSFAILTVILAHSVLSYGSPQSLSPLQFGGTGVDLFFVLSGWLLGCQLFKEAKNSNKIDIKKFWYRRWMRTLPAYYLVLFFSISQRYLTHTDISFPWSYLIFVQNYNYPLEFFSISWSLSVEEQFYLVIAPLLALLLKQKKLSTTFTLIILLCVPYLLRTLGLFGNLEQTHVRWDGCIMGVFLANIRYYHPNVWKTLLRISPITALISLLGYLFVFYVRWHPELLIPDPDKLLLAFMFGTWVIFANSSSSWSHKLNFPGANYIATRSYAMYLLHPEALALFKRINFHWHIPFIIYFIGTLIITLLISELLFRFVEKPIMDMRERFSFSKQKTPAQNNNVEIAN